MLHREVTAEVENWINSKLLRKLAKQK